MLSVLFKWFSSQHIFILTTTGTTITTHRSKTGLDLCHLCNLCELLYTNGLELTIKNYKFIFDNLWKFTGISVKYKTQIGTNGHKLSKILLLKRAGPSKRVESWELRTERYDYHWYCPNSQIPINSSKFKVHSSKFQRPYPASPMRGGAGLEPVQGSRFNTFKLESQAGKVIKLITFHLSLVT